MHVGGETTGSQIPAAISNHNGNSLKWQRSVGTLASGPTWFRYFLKEIHSFTDFGIQNRCLSFSQKYSNFAGF
jgi:hypothetical protein